MATKANTSSLPDVVVKAGEAMLVPFVDRPVDTVASMANDGADAVKLTVPTFAFEIVTVREAGVMMTPLFVGATVYDPFSRPPKL